MEISNFFTLKYYFDLSPEASILSIFIAIYFVAIFAVRPYIRIVAGRHAENKIVKKLQKKHIERLAIIGVLGILTIAARHVTIPLLGMRVIAYALILWSFYEFWQIKMVHSKRAYAVGLDERATAVEDKYLPKPKRKKNRER